MPEANEIDELVAYLARTSRLTPSEAARLVDEVVNFMGETVEAFVRRRHLALQASGADNAAIFARIAVELERRRFRAAVLSARQIRRLIYG